MKKNLSPYIRVLGLIAAFVIPSHMLAQQPRYELIDLGTFGGPHAFLNDGNGGNNSVSILNNRGAVAGWANTTSPDPFPSFCFDDDDCFVSHAFQWHGGVLNDLGALDSGLSSQAVWISQSGLIAGTSENGEIDPLFAGFPELRAVVWKDGHIIDLGTLPEGGFESSANAVNSRGQVVGWATNTIPDGENSLVAPGFAPTQTRAFLWQHGAMRDLGTLGKGTDAMSEFINDRGQVVGYSYTGKPKTSFCIFPETTHSFIWDEKNKMRDLGTLGGSCAIATGINDNGTVVGDNVNDQTIQRAFIWKDGAIQDLGGTLGGLETGAEAINESGQIAGIATLPGEVLYHATLWRRVGDMTDLGVLDGDSCSFASSINSKSQIVGASQTGTEENGCASFDDSPPRAFLWENGSILDLNDLIPPGATLNLTWAEAINERGEIAGSGLDADGNAHDFLLVPCIANEASDCQEEIVGTAAPVQPGPAGLSKQIAGPNNPLRQMLRRALGPVPHILAPTRGGSGTEGRPATEASTSLQITSGPAPSGTVGKLYDFRCAQIPPCNVFLAGFPVTATGGVQPYSWSWTAQQGSSLPPGLMFPDISRYQCLNARPPAICGKPTKAGTYNVVVTVKDSESPPSHASKSYTIHIFP